MNNYGITDDLIDQLKKAKQSVEDVEKLINFVASQHSGIKKNDVVEDTDNGYHYQVEWFSVSFDRMWKPYISLYGYRLWRTGRKAGRRAHNGTFLSLTNVKKVETNDTKE